MKDGVSTTEGEDLEPIMDPVTVPEDKEALRSIDAAVDAVFDDLDPGGNGNGNGKGRAHGKRAKRAKRAAEPRAGAEEADAGSGDDAQAAGEDDTPAASLHVVEVPEAAPAGIPEELLDEDDAHQGDRPRPRR